MEACKQVLDESFKPRAIFTSGVMFGLGWWIWGDAVTVGAVSGERFQPLFLIPGLIATLAVLMMNCAPRDELAASDYGDDAGMCRSRLTLFISYVFSVAAIGSAVALLIAAKSREEEDLWIGAASIIQACFIVGSGLVTWFFRESGDGDSYGMIY